MRSKPEHSSSPTNLNPQNAPEESGRSTVSCVDVPRPPSIHAARKQFRSEQDDLLQSSRGRFVAYHGTKRLQIVDSLTEGYEVGLALQLPREEIAVFWIESYASPQNVQYSVTVD